MDTLQVSTNEKSGVDISTNTKNEKELLAQSYLWYFVLKKISTTKDSKCSYMFYEIGKDEGQVLITNDSKGLVTTEQSWTFHF